MNEGIVLLCLNLTAICVYLPCRWKYAAFPPPAPNLVRQYLSYLYLGFFATLPFKFSAITATTNGSRTTVATWLSSNDIS